MKLSRVISFTLGNSLVVFIFASLLTSCQKKSFQSHGALTKLAVKNGRYLASNNNTLPHFTSFQDPKQIMVFCENTSKKVKVCYNHQISTFIKKFTEKHIGLSLEQREDLRTSTSYSNIRPIFDNTINQIKLDNNEKLNKIVDSRKLFCEKHSKYNLSKCLNQYLEKDTFSVLNFFHGNEKLNGHEYIYLKKEFKHLLSQRLLKAKDSIQLKRKSTL